MPLRTTVILCRRGTTFNYGEMADGTGSNVLAGLGMAFMFALASVVLFGCWVHRERLRMQRTRSALWCVSVEQYKAFASLFEEYEWPTQRLMQATHGLVHGSESFEKAVAETLEPFCGVVVVSVQ